tara:strand:- start:429 stop:665 length:237 start_codon:yes stop_codon:yes gene_type:complete
MVFKHTRQKKEYISQTGRLKIKEKINNTLENMNKDNYVLLHNNIKNFIKYTKQKYLIKNITKSERILIQTINYYKNLK